MRQLKLKKAGLYVMTLLYIVAGINHFAKTDVYISIMPPWLSYKRLLVYVSGGCEILFGILLLAATTRRLGAWAIILLLIAVYPANIQMAVNYYRSGSSYFWITILRLPLQFILIWWAYQYTKKGIISVIYIQCLL